MGKGDKKSKRGKIILGSYGVRRSRKAGKKAAATASVSPVIAEVKQTPPAAKATKPKTASPKAPAKTAAKAAKTEGKTEAKTTHKAAPKKKE